MSYLGHLTSLEEIGKITLLSLLVTQLIIWAIEIHLVGFRPWMHQSIDHSYGGYIRKYGRREWTLFFSVFTFVLVTLTLIWQLV
jgi:hypothetical protein